ncbi:MAG: HAMP domain-containing protein, partial [Cyanobium sp.]
REATGRYLWQLYRLFPDAPYLNYGLANGDFIGLGQVDNTRREPFLELAEAQDIKNLRQYRLDALGQRTGPPNLKTFADFRGDGWYAVPWKAGREAWIPIYNWVDAPQVMAMGIGMPIRRQGVLLGVAEVDVFLANISRYLRQLPLSRSGMVYVVDEEGLLVADASGSLPFTIQKGTGIRLRAQDARDPLVRRTALGMTNRFGSFQILRDPRQLRLSLSSGNALIRVEPYRDPAGLDWRIVVVTPEADVSGELRQRALHQLLLSLAAILLSVAISLAVVEFVGRWLRQLVIGSDAMAEGNLAQRVEPGPIRELAQLAESFNTMAERLRRSFGALRARNREMRQLIDLRNRELKGHQQELVRESRQRQTLEFLLEGAEQHPQPPLTDPLSGLFSRRGLQRRWTLLERRGEDGGPASLALLELSIRSCNTSGEVSTLPENRILEQIVPVLEQRAEAAQLLLAHDGQGRFSLLLPDGDADAAIAWIRGLQEVLAPTAEQPETAHLLIQAGIAILDPAADGDGRQRIWERGEQALRHAQASDCSGWVLAD